MAVSRTFHWNGVDLPQELQELPPGDYVLAPAEHPPLLTPEEQDGLRLALDSLRAGKGRTREQVQHRIEAILRR